MSLTANSISNNNLTLFNSLSTGSSVSSSNLNSNILGIDLGEYASITRGSYSKLTKAYYAKYGNKKLESTASQASDPTVTKEKTALKNDANNLYKAADALVTTGKNSVFKKVDVKNAETGITTKEYDTDKIYKAVSSLVDSYNSLVESSAKSTDNAVLRKTLHMVNSASANSSLLNDIGIKIGSDNKLSIDEDTFKKADMSTVSTLFNGFGSFGSDIQSTAGTIYANINNSLGNSNVYTSSGTLGNYSTGNLLDSLL